jgi:hypothetical protein
MIRKDTKNTCMSRSGDDDGEKGGEREGEGEGGDDLHGEGDTRLLPTSETVGASSPRSCLSEGLWMRSIVT